MANCDDLLEHLQHETETHVALAVNALAPAVAEMHLDLALFHAEQVRTAEDLCLDLEEERDTGFLDSIPLR